MNIDLKVLAIGSIVLLCLGAAAGRYATPEKVIVKTVQVEKKQIDKNEHKDVIIDKRVNKDGSSETITKISDDSNTHITDKKETKSETIVNNPKNWNVSLLVSPVANDDIFPTGSLSYGVHVQRKILGPISVGAFGLTNRTYGLSVGVEF